MPHRHVQSDDRTVAPAHNIGFLDIEPVEQRHDVVGHQVIPERLVVARAAPMSAAVHHDNAMMSGERQHLVAEIVGIGQAAVEHHDRRASTDLRVEQPDSIEFGVSGP